MPLIAADAAGAAAAAVQAARPVDIWLQGGQKDADSSRSSQQSRPSGVSATSRDAIPDGELCRGMDTLIIT